MNFWFANINKIENIDEASKVSEINIRKGTRMTSTVDSINPEEKVEEKFYTLFCKDREDAKKILTKYFEIMNESSKLYREHKEHFIDRMIGGRT